MKSPLSVSAERVNSSRNAPRNQRLIPLSRSARIQSGDSVTALHIPHIRNTLSVRAVYIFRAGSPDFFPSSDLDTRYAWLFFTTIQLVSYFSPMQKRCLSPLIYILPSAYAGVQDTISLSSGDARSLYSGAASKIKVRPSLSTI
jgi:hypothetical protein